MQNKKNLKRAAAKVMLAVTKSTANSTCIFATHQPKVPADAKKLRKF